MAGTKATRSSHTADTRTPAEKRLETIAKKKLQQSTAIQSMEHGPNKDKALLAPSGRGATATSGGRRGVVSTPTSSKKRVGSPTLTRSSNSAKKPKAAAPTAKPNHSPSVYRRAPPAITLEDDDDVPAETDDEHSIAYNTMPPRHRGQNSKLREPQAAERDEERSEASGFDTPDGESEDKELDFDDGTEGLAELDSQALKETLLSERVQWGKSTGHTSRARSSRKVSKDPATVTGLDDSSPLNTLNMADKSDADDVYADAVSDGNNSMDVEDEVPVPVIPAKGKRQRQGGKRELARRAEVPKWSRSKVSSGPEPKVRPHQTTKVEPISDDEHMGEVSNHNAGWAPAAHYIPPAPGARNISVRAQPQDLKLVLSTAMRKLEVKTLAENAYPPSGMIVTYMRDIIKECAEMFQFSEICDRLVNDAKFAVVLSRPMAVRLSHIRGNPKSVIELKIDGFFHLTGVTIVDCKQRVDALISNTSYIYPKNESGNIIRTKPFHHPVIISTLKDLYFARPRGGGGGKNPEMFTSSVEAGPGKHEPEIPVAMLCIVATVLHSALDDWADGYRQATDFNADLYEGVYRGHEKFLRNIREGSLPRYHRLMSDLYNAVAANATHRSAAVADNAMLLLNLEDMDV